MIKYQEYIKEKSFGEIVDNSSFRELTTLGIGGAISCLYYPNSIENFVYFYQYYLEEKRCSLMVIGNGSNILASDKDFKGIVVSFKKIDVMFSMINNTVKVSSGLMMNSLIKKLAANNYGGLENLYGIPGTIGGMVAMNAGAYHLNISDVLICATCIDRNGIIKSYSNEELSFAYRYSIVQKNLIVLDATFNIVSKDYHIIKTRLDEIQNDRQTKQPLRNKNAGSSFKNVLPFSAWKMIDSIGLRGASVNDAQISAKHTNFLINRGHATSSDMIALINMVQREVEKKYGIWLENEWIKVNFIKEK